MRLTSCGEGAIIRTQAEEEEEWGEPDTDGKECCHVSKRGGLDYRPTAGLAHGVVCLVHKVQEVEEPEEVVGDEGDARCSEGLGGGGDGGPYVREVLRVDNMADGGEGELVHGEHVCECEQNI